MHAILSAALLLAVGALTYAINALFIRPRFNPLLKLAGPPPVGGLWHSDLGPVLSANISAVYHAWRPIYGRSMRIRGLTPWDERLLTLDPTSITHILKHTTTYEKPWQSRALLSGLIGCGMLAAEGAMHKRQRRVATPAFSIQNLCALVPLVFRKGSELRDKWLELIAAQGSEKQGEGIELDVCHWVSRATFDVIGLAGFDYQFSAIQDESNELFNAFKDMFEIGISQGSAWSTAIMVYAPWLYKIFPTKLSRTVARCQEVINRVAGNLVQEKKCKIEEGERSGVPYAGKDLLSLLLKSNISVDLPPDQRISDEDILNNVNTFMFAGSDTSSLTLTWTLQLLATHPTIQTRLRTELLAALPPNISLDDIPNLTEDEIHSLYSTIAELPLLHNVVRESIRVVPGVQSSIRVATKDDEIPTNYPVRMADGTWSKKASVTIQKGSFVHIAVDGFNRDKEFWGEDAWEFKWDDLPELAKQLPGLFEHTLTFSGGPRSCIGQRFSLIEIKCIVYALITTFMFKPSEDKVTKSNVILTRPYISKRFEEGSQCPLIIVPYTGKLSPEE